MVSTQWPMDTPNVLSGLGIKRTALTPEQREQLDVEGYFIVHDVYTPEECQEMAAEFERIAEEEGRFGGSETRSEPGARRVAAVFSKSTAFDRVLTCAPLLVAASELLGEIRIHADNMREPLVGHGHQPLHSDVPSEGPGKWRLVNSLHLFDDMTKENGGTRIVPGSHRWASLNIPPANIEKGFVEPEDLDRSHIPEDPFAPHPEEIVLEAPAGSVVVLNAHLWHGGTKRVSDAPRRMLHLSICRRELDQQLNQREYVTDAMRERMSDELLWLLDVL
ncbi:Phytanoyl-CoA dioxygenase (PhyH) [Pseudonocardia thermophila]|uniref:Phytanoyl-CoA dioxygenase (PhyH) n=1 Tax=Pseudonocardia thermophila TaxID=1848 RepID=A0A1M6WQ48_PSETH|nr:phytanoyl-CoA dioxygenase family protein [Pseudonocardia thermophila]SHK95857.1 Phytanoyl-CoA dioxygenase (PhyH) [Pseudonocardia thermophila]